MNPYKIVSKYDNVIRNFFQNMLIGCNGQSYSRLYLDLHGNEIFQNAEASCNTWLHREDGSLAEIAHDNGFGADLSEDETDYLKECGVSDFGFEDWLDGYLIPNIKAALENWKEQQCKK
jgi:hypothetical protein|nr:MAG TPA: hypothetical protein [Caudoviricetes sp.]